MFTRFIRAAVIFARHQAWVDQPLWDNADAEELTRFLTSPSGIRLKAALVNMNLRQQSASLSASGDLKFEAGYCNGQKACIAAIESLTVLKSLTEQGETEDADPATN